MESNMNQFIHDYNETLEFEGGFISEQDECALIEHILAESEHTDLDQFVMANISYEQALEIVQTDDQFTADAQDWIDNRPDLS